MGAQWYDGLIAIPGCDKNMPGFSCNGRVNRPSIMVWRNNSFWKWKGESLNIVSAFEALGKNLTTILQKILKE
jgi:dihydroxy-acid dehydratase